MPTKELTDAFLRNLTWEKALRTVEKEHRERNAKRREQGKPEKALKPPRQVSYLEKQTGKKLSLMLMLSYGGTRSFRAVTYDNGVPQYWKLGTFPQMSIKQARAKAEQYYANPQKVENAAEVGSFKEVAELWFKDHVEEQKLISAPEIRRQLEKYVYPKWGTTKFLEIRRRSVNQLLRDIRNNYSAAMANYVLATLRGIFTWYQVEDEDYVSPIVKGMRRGKPKARERILTDNEIRRVWEAAGECSTFGAWIKFALLTAQRKEKITTMRWDDLDNGEWTIRAEQREKGTGGVLKLPQLALDVIEDQRQRRIAGNPYVFAGSTRGRRRKPSDKPLGPPTFNSFSKAKKALDIKLGDLPRWTLHDLRRTARSLMSRAGVHSDVAERVLGHAIGGVREIYDRHRYFDEKADALNRLAREVSTIINPSPDNVVAMPKRTGPRR